MLRTENVVRFITFEGKAAIIPGQQIKDIQKLILQSSFEVSVFKDNFRYGEKVEIIKGPLTGLQGELINYFGKNRFILRVEQIRSTFSVEVPANHLTFLPDDMKTHQIG